MLGSQQTAIAESVPVTVSPLEQLIGFPQITAPATVISLNNSHLSTELAAVIEDIMIEVGQVVTSGTPLVQLDKTDHELTLKRAEAILQSLEARYKLAQSQLQRAQTLAKQQSVSEELLTQRQSALEESEAELMAQRATIEQLQRNLEKTVIRAPFKAIVVERIGNVGELAAPGTPLIRIVDAEHIEISAKLQAQDTASLREADTTHFVSQDIRYPVKLHRITPILDIRERSQEVRLHFVDTHPLIGTAGQLVWHHKEPHLSADLLVRRADALGIFVAEQDHAKFIALPGAQEGRPAGIGDLPKSNPVIVDGRFALKDGDPINIVEASGVPD